MFNKVILVGRLTRDPDVRYTQPGKAVATFDLAVERDFKNANGEKEADFIRIVAWDKLAEICGNNLSKGRLVLLEGRLQIRAYETQDGQKRRATEVVAQNVKFLDRAKTTAESFGQEVHDDDSIPF